ncbi:FAD-dependent oxidoreductase [Sphingobacterium sp. N143]|nr:FAD-dependent oxidoreductase [Sphingobacterium sp. N143]
MKLIKLTSCILFSSNNCSKGSASGYSTEVRKEFVLKQLVDLLGPDASFPTSYFDKVWTDEYILSGSQIIHRPHQNNGHPSLQQSYMNGRLFFAATETAVEFSGYMEGAVIAAKRMSEKLI